MIGGILISDRGQTVQRVPFFADLPLIGWLFREKVARDDKRELLIFITPRIVKQETVGRSSEPPCVTLRVHGTDRARL